MGTPVNPDDFETYGTCPACFDNGAPKFVTAMISGVKTNPLVVPPGPAALPNGQWHLTKTSLNNCVWVWDGPVWFMQFTFAGGQANFLCRRQATMFEAIFNTAPICTGGPFAGWADTALKFYAYGSASVGWGSESSSPSMFAYSELLGIPADESLNADIWPVDSETVNILNVSWKNNVNIQYSLDLPEFDQYFDIER